MEALLTKIAFLRVELVRAHLADFFKLHDSLGSSHMVPRQKFRPNRQLVRGEAQ
jgi:hypothetical protein